MLLKSDEYRKKARGCLLEAEMAPAKLLLKLITIAQLWFELDAPLAKALLYVDRYRCASAPGRRFAIIVGVSAALPQSGSLIRSDLTTERLRSPGRMRPARLLALRL